MPRDKEPWILGISASHNGAACLLRGDELVVAIQEERLSRFKRHCMYGAGPSLSIDYCLRTAGIDPAELDLVVLCGQGEAQSDVHDVTRDPFLKVLTHQIPTLTTPHHYGHALSAFATSGFAEAALLRSLWSCIEHPQVILRSQTGCWRINEKTGAFINVHQPDTPGYTTAVYLEGIAAAAHVAAA
jgi:hypothetical protein